MRLFCEICNWKSEQLNYTFLNSIYPEAVTVGVRLKKVFLEISQNSQENTSNVGISVETLEN